MTPALLDLGRRAVACPRWRWMSGMLGVFADGRKIRVENGDLWTSFTAVPDFSDPATRGCLLALVREAWGDPLLVVVYFRQEGRWCVASRDGRAMFAAGRYFWGDDEPAALLTALEAAP